MSSIDQIYDAVRTLTVAERLRLVERVVHDVLEASKSQESPAGESLIGLFADEPELIDEVCRMAMEDRANRSLRVSDG